MAERSTDNGTKSSAGTVEDATALLSENDEPNILSSYLEEKNVGADMSWYAAVFLVVNAALGAGLLDFPLSFHKSGGILPSMILQVILMSLITVSLLMYVYCSKLFKSQSYQDVVIALCGKHVGISCGVLVILYSFITNVTFMIVICDQWQKFIQLLNPAYATTPPWFFDRRFFITISSVLLILPLSFSKKIDFLKYPSLLGVLVMFYLMFLVLVKYFVGVDGAKVGPVRSKPENVFDLIAVIPTICFGYQCHLNIVPIYQSTRGATFSKTIFASMFICFVVYSTFAIFGYLTFGSCVQADILLCYLPTPEVLAAVVGVAVKMFVSYPLQLYVGRQVAEDLVMMVIARRVDFEEPIDTILIEPSASSSAGILPTLDDDDVELLRQEPSVREKWELIVRAFIVTVWFAVSLLISLVVSDIGKVIPLLGAMASLFIFVYPGACMIRLMTRDPPHTFTPLLSTCLMAVSVTILLLGAFIFGVTITNLFSPLSPAHALICT